MDCCYNLEIALLSQMDSVSCAIHREELGEAKKGKIAKSKIALFSKFKFLISDNITILVVSCVPGWGGGGIPMALPSPVPPHTNQDHFLSL